MNRHIQSEFDRFEFYLSSTHNSLFYTYTNLERSSSFSKLSFILAHIGLVNEEKLDRFLYKLEAKELWLEEIPEREHLFGRSNDPDKSICAAHVSFYCSILKIKEFMAFDIWLVVGEV